MTYALTETTLIHAPEEPELPPDEIPAAVTVYWAHLDEDYENAFAVWTFFKPNGLEHEGFGSSQFPRNESLRMFF